MTVSAAYAPLEFAGNGVTVAFPVSWPFVAAADLLVTEVDDASGTESVKALTTHYTVVQTAAGGTVTALTAPATGKTWRIERRTPKTQPDQLRLGGAYNPETVEAMIDRPVLMLQELDERVPQFGQPSTGAPLVFDGEGNVIAGSTELTGDMALRGELADGADAAKGAALLGYTPTSTGVLTTVRAFLESLWTAGASTGAAMVRFVQAGTGAVARSLQDKARESVTPEDFGAVGDGVTDDGPALQAMIDYLESIGDVSNRKGGTAQLGAGKIYGTAQSLLVRKAIRLHGAGPLADTNNANGIPAPNCMIVALAGFPSSSAVLRVQSATAGNYLREGELRGVAIRGAGLAQYGIWMSSCVNWVVDVTARECIGAGVRLDDGNAAYSKSNEFWVNYVLGTGAVATTCAASHGLWLSGQDYGNPQNIIYRVSGLRRNGDGLRLQGNVDNCLINHVGVAEDGLGDGSGRNLAFRGKEAPGTGAGARNNFVFYSAGGKIYAGATTYGNRILAMPSEANSVEIVSGGQLHYCVTNYVNSAVHRTHEYLMSGEQAYSAAAMDVDGTNATKSRAVTIWPIVSYADAATGWAGGSFARHEWGTGNITGIRLHYTTASAVSGQNFRIQFRLTNRVTGASIATPQVNESFNLPGPATGNNMTVYEHTFGSPAGFTRDALVMFLVERLGADAADTAAVALQLHAIEFLYTSSGPTVGGGGPYDVSAPGT